MRSDCATLWIGDSLGPVERACLRSVLRLEHSVALYCYSKPGGVPRGIEVRDASAILPESAILRHSGGSVALFSDWFRFELQRRSLGTWIDTDNYLVGRLDLERPYLFGRQVLSPPRPWSRRRKEMIAVGVLRLPPDSLMLGPLLDQFRGECVPDWLSLPWLVRAKFLKRIGRPIELSKLPWGTAGPFAVDALAKRFGLGGLALPTEVFNPVPWYDARWILDPARTLEEVVTDRTVTVHLWNECIKGFKHEPAPAGSFLQRLHSEGA